MSYFKIVSKFSGLKGEAELTLQITAPLSTHFVFPKVLKCHPKN